MPILTSILLWLTLIMETPAEEMEIIIARESGFLSMSGDAAHRRDINLTSLSKVGMFLMFLHFINLKWDKNEPEFLEKVETIVLREAELNPNSLMFSDSLESVSLINTTFINGTLSDFLKTATTVKEINIEDMGDIRISISAEPSPITDIFRSSLTRLKLSNTIIKIDGNPPLFLSRLEKTVLKNTAINPNHITFGDELSSLKLHNTKIVNGTLGQILSTTSDLKTLTITGTVAEVDLLELPGTLTKADFQGFTILNNGKSGVQVLLNLKKLKFLDMNCKGVFGENLENVKMMNSTVTVNGMSFSSSLKSVELQNTKFENGSLYDFLKTATNVSSVSFRSMNQIIDFSKLPITESVIQLSITNSQLIFTTPVKFIKLERLALTMCGTLEKNSFQNFDELFPNIERVTMQFGTIVTPAVLLSMLKCHHLKYMHVAFDFAPQIKTYEFGEAMKVLTDLGFNQSASSNHKERVLYVSFKRDDGEAKWKLSLTSEIYHWRVSEKDVKAQDPQIIVYTYFVLLSLLMLIGIIGNTLSICVLFRKKLRNSSGFILLSLTLCDSLVILTYIASSVFNGKIFYNVFVKTGTKQKFLTVEDSWMAEQDDVQAFFIYPLNKTGYTGSVFTTVLISFERFVAVCWPLQSKRLLSSKNSKRAILVILIFSVLLNFPRWIESHEWSYYSDSSKHWNDYYRPTLMRMEIYRTIYHERLWVIVMYVLPFVLLAFFNYRIFRQIKLSSLARSCMQSPGSEISNKIGEDTENKAVTKMLLWVVAVFVLCNSFHIIIIFYFIIVYDNIKLSTIEAISCLPIIINSSVNFIIYFVLGKTLRAEFLKIVPAWFLCFRSWKSAKTAEMELSIIPSASRR